MPTFTPKQIRIMSLVTDGLKNREIAAEINTTENTVKNYLRTILDISGMDSRLQLALWFITRQHEGSF